MKVVFILLIRSVLSANILHIVTLGTRSHHIWNRALALGLVEKSHNVTMITHTKEKEKSENFHVIVLEGFFEKVYDSFSLDSLTETDEFLDVKKTYDFSLYSCEHDFSTEGFRRILNYPKDFIFDLIIIDITLGQCFYPLIERFGNPPIVAVTPFKLPPVFSHVFGNPLQAAFVPFYSTNYLDRMSFLQRIKNFLLTHFEVFYRTYFGVPAEYKLAKKYFGEDIRSFEEVERNMSILITSYDPLFDFPMALPPNIIPAGGLHVQPVKPLPNDLQTIIDDAKHGLIIFTLGSYLRSDHLSSVKKSAILNAFAKLPQTIFWKFESEIENCPKNVIVRKWLPQNDLLGNSKTKLLITHGGLLSTQEAMYHGVPIIVIPFFIDQHTNGEKLADRNMAKVLSYQDISSENLYAAVTEVISNGMYSKNIKQLSQRFKEAPEGPLKRAVYWVEYVLRHGSLEYLNLASRDMWIYQSAGYDVIFALLLGICLIYALLSFIFTCCRFMCTKSAI